MMDAAPNNSFERTHPRALAALGRCGVPLNSGVRPQEYDARCTSNSPDNSQW